MRYNCYTYNQTRNPHLLGLVDTLQTYLQKYIEEVIHQS